MIEYPELEKKHLGSKSMYYAKEDPNMRLWKYLSFEKFMSIITSNTLWFSHIKQFNDPKEGYFQMHNFHDKWLLPLENSGVPEDPLEVDQVPTNDRYVDISDFKPERMKMIKECVNRTYINCWNISEFDSDLMWHVYGGSTNSVALVTRYDKLLSSILESKDLMHFEARKVIYADVNTVKFLLSDRFAPLFVKARRYRDENELRITAHNYRLAGDDDNSLTDYGDIGIAIDINISEAIDYVAINPHSSKWFINTVKSICRKENLHFSIIDH